MPDVRPTSTDWELVDNTEPFTSPFTGATQTLARGGERLRCTLRYSNLHGNRRRLILAFLADLKGRENRAIICDHAYTPSGSIVVNEILADPYFSNVAANWSSANSSLLSLSATSQGMRLKQLQLAYPNHFNSSDASVVQGVSYALNWHGKEKSLPNGTTSIRAGVSTSEIAEVVDEQVTYGQGARFTKGYTSPSTTLRVGGLMAGGAGVNESIEYQEISSARGFLVDNGVNQLLRSQEFDNASWTKIGCSISANAQTAKDGTVTADAIVEDTSTGIHAVVQSSSKVAEAQYWTASVHVEANGRGFSCLQIDDGGGTNLGRAWVNLTTGEVTNVVSSGTFENVYATSHDCGGGIYRLRVSVRTDSSTTVRAVVYAADSGSTFSYTGDGSSGIYLWGAQLQQGGQLGRYVATTSAAATPDSQTGSEVWLKGLDLNTNGQLVAGDLIEINQQLLRLTSDLDGDESGVGLASVTPRIRNAPADEAACVLYQPSGRFMLETETSGWSNSPGIFSDITLTFIEDIAS